MPFSYPFSFNVLLSRCHPTVKPSSAGFVGCLIAVQTLRSKHSLDVCYGVFEVKKFNLTSRSPASTSTVVERCARTS